MTFQQPTKWRQRLTAAEWWYNTNYHSALQMTPFMALYGYPPSQISLLPSAENSSIATNWVKGRQDWDRLLKENLEVAQNKMKQNADKRSFEVGDGVYLKLQPYRQSSIALRRNLKLSSKCYGPSKILQKVGAYKLELPADAPIHPVFHVSMLKKFAKGVSVSGSLPQVIDDGTVKVAPQATLDRRMIKRGNSAVTQVLADWVNMSPAEATW